MTRKRHVLAPFATAASTLVIAAAAHAGAYQVHACDAAGGVNNSWSASANNGQMTAYSQCPSGGNSTRGMVARNAVQAGNATVPPGTMAWLRFDAAPGTSIIGINASYRFVRAGLNTGWEVGLSNGAKVLTGCPTAGVGCVSKGANDSISVPGSQTIYIEAFCAYSPCPTGSSGDPVYGYIQAGANLYSASVTLSDGSQPALGSFGGDLWSAGWKGGTRTVSFDASDNSGISQTRALLDGAVLVRGEKPCDFTRTVPCQQGGSSFALNTLTAGKDGAHTLTVQAVDAAGNTAEASRQVLLDNTPPAPPQQVHVDGGDGWRATNSFALRWTNPAEPGTAPIVGAEWEVCPAEGRGACKQGRADRPDITSADRISVPDAGDHVLRLWLRDAASNADRRTAAEPIHLRFDDDAPRAEFAAHDPNDPTLLAVNVSDKTSGLGGGTIEIKRAGTDGWQAVDARVAGSRLVTHLDDEQLRRGVYDVRALVRDQAGNERSVSTRENGDPMQVTVPLRRASKLRAGAVRRVRRHGKRSTVLRARVRVGFGRRTRIRGRLTQPDGAPLADTEITVFERRRQAGAPWTLIATLRTSRRGGFSYLAAKGVSRVIRFRYDGTTTVRPVNRDVALRVAAGSTIHVNRRNYVTGETATFTGRLRGANVPPEGKLIELQVLIRRRFRTFATTRADAHGRWRYDYRFDGTHGTQRYRFRARIPREATYPFETGRSRRVRVVVRGL